MSFALFGKLPAKRDFIALSASREILAVWEPWLQGGISASRLKLGKEWQDAFLKAPIWRFWLGSEICGATIAGAFMPSMDGVGRYFPLTVFARPDEGGAIPPPELEPQDAWFESIEEFLLTALDADTSYEGLTAALGLLQGPAQKLSTPPHEDLRKLPDGSTLVDMSQDYLPNLLSAIRMEDYENTYGIVSYWWTIGGEEFKPQALAARRMPDPYLFTGMLTGQFDTAPGR